MLINIKKIDFFTFRYPMSKETQIKKNLKKRNQNEQLVMFVNIKKSKKNFFSY
jgi:hypothetical protein